MIDVHTSLNNANNIEVNKTPENQAQHTLIEHFNPSKIDTMKNITLSTQK